MSKDPVAAAKQAVAEAAARAAASQVASGLRKLVDDTLTDLEAAQRADPDARPDADPLERLRARYGVGDDAPAPREDKADTDAKLRAQLAEMKKKMGK